MYHHFGMAHLNKSLKVKQKTSVFLIEINIKAEFYWFLFHSVFLYTVNYSNMYKHHLNQDYIHHYFDMVSVDNMDLNLKRPIFLSFELIMFD